MEKMFNPFLEGQPIEETPISYIMDKALNGSEDQKAVFKFFQYLLARENTPVYDELIKELINIIGSDNYNLIKTIYFDTYNKETKMFTRYAYFDDRNDIRRIYNTFIIINKNIDTLRTIAYKYQKGC